MKRERHLRLLIPKKGVAGRKKKRGLDEKPYDGK